MIAHFEQNKGSKMKIEKTILTLFAVLAAEVTFAGPQLQAVCYSYPSKDYVFTAKIPAVPAKNEPASATLISSKAVMTGTASAWMAPENTRTTGALEVALSTSNHRSRTFKASFLILSIEAFLMGQEGRKTRASGCATESDLSSSDGYCFDCEVTVDPSFSK